MAFIANVICFIIAIFVSIKFCKDRFGIKQLGTMCAGFILYSGLIYVCAKHLKVGFVLLPTQPALAEPQNAMKVSLMMLKTGLVFFPICYFFEFWYYRKHPDIDPYSGKKKSEVEAEERERQADKKRRKELKKAKAMLLEEKKQEWEDIVSGKDNDDDEGNEYRKY